MQFFKVCLFWSLKNVSLLFQFKFISDDYLSYAFEFVHDYIDEEISQSLKSSLK